MADEPLSNYLDRLISVAYATLVRGVGYKFNDPTAASMVHYIEDEKTGRPVPIDDSADHFLLRSFDELRREYRTRPLPVYEEPAPVCGEIPWRNMHTKLCRTCGRRDDEPSLVCSAGHLDIRSRLSHTEPGKVMGPGRAIPVKKEDEQ